MFRTVFLSIIRSFSLHTQQWYVSYKFADSKPVRHIPLLSEKLYDIYHCCVYSEKLLGQRNCPKHVEFYFKKIEKLVHLVGVIIRITEVHFFWSTLYDWGPR